MRSIAELEKRIRYLEEENKYLKNLLEGAGISYCEKERDGGNEYDPDQGSRIIPRDITGTDAKVFFSMFWGRTDVYSKRTIKKSTGEVNYYTQCYNFWKNGCLRITGSKTKCQDCQRQAYKELKKEQIIDHLRGSSEDSTDVIGVFPLLTDDTCRFIVFDFDNHEKGAEKNDFANADDLWRDEVDSHIPMFDRMYHKRLKAYKQIGYDIFSGTGEQKQMTNAIFDINNYKDTYQNDLLAAEKEIVMSSPAISSKKVYDMIHLLREKQEEGIKIVIVTWKPDCYGYGDSAYWQELQEQMRRAGFEVNLVEDYCEHYCIIDRQVVWYGSMNFLGKEDAEDNLMRISDGKIANELLEMTFGNEKYQGETM